MGNQWRIGFTLIYASFFLIATTPTCFGAENSSFCNEQERLALLKFKQSVSDEFGMLASWVGKDCCRWNGVRCDASTGSVVSLRLIGQNLWNSYYFPESNPDDQVPIDNEHQDVPVGEDCYLADDELNSSLAELRNLRYLDLSGNDFRKSQIPAFIGSLKRLAYLNLSNAGFSGMIPSNIGNLSMLEVLDLSARNGNDLIADDIGWVFSLSSLKCLNLSGVDLFRARNVDVLIYKIPTLSELSLSHCDLTNAHFGPYVNQSSTLPNIQYLDLSKNFFKDNLPPFLQNMTSLAFLDISNSDFSLPLNLVDFLNMIPSLSELHLSDCELQNENLSLVRLNFSLHSKIQHLDLSRNLIEGRFRPVLTNLSSLRVLDLHGNLLNSSIPVMPNLLELDISSNNLTDIEHVGIWRQCHLKQLSVSWNYLRNEMIDVSTNISECSRNGLEVLNLDHNKLTGSIPEALVRLTSLRVLDLSSNELINSIPSSLERLRKLEALDLSSNELNGKIPTSIGQFGNLNFLNLSRNQLEGMVDESHFANLSRLTYFDISSNSNLTLSVSCDWIPPFQLTSVVLSSCTIMNGFPQWLRTQRKLKKLVLSKTSISGPLPTWFEQMPIIPHLDLSANNLTGPLTNLPLRDRFNGFQDYYRGSLILQNNLFSGSIPKSLCQRTALEVLDLSLNRLTGEIPVCLENLRKLRAMILSHNRLSGSIPSSIGKNSLLLWLHLNDNMFTRELPPNMANLHALWVLDLGNNNLSGEIPEWISELKELMVLRLYNNTYTGRIPISLCKSACLQIFDVAHNKLNGTIPRCLGELSGMINPYNCRHHIYSNERLSQVFKGSQYEYSIILSFLINMDLSSNELVGAIPKELMNLSALRGLNCSHNHLIGNIPDNIGNMKNLETLDFSVNMLTGIIPQSMAQLLFLSALNLSHNNLSGQIPDGSQMETFDSSSYADNEALCGSPLEKICPNPIPITTRTRKDKHKNRKLWFYLDVMCGFVTGFLIVIGPLLFKKQWRNDFYRIADVTMDNIYVAVVVKLNQIKRRGEPI